MTRIGDVRWARQSEPGPWRWQTPCKVPDRRALAGWTSACPHGGTRHVEAFPDPDGESCGAGVDGGAEPRSRRSTGNEVPPGRARRGLWLRQGRCVPRQAEGRKRHDVCRGTPAHLDQPVIGPDDAPSSRQATNASSLPLVPASAEGEGKGAAGTLRSALARLHVHEKLLCAPRLEEVAGRRILQAEFLEWGHGFPGPIQ